MKTILCLMFLSVLVFVQMVPGEEKIHPANQPGNTNADVDFKTEILPILQKRCSPCHFPGGKMYERLPFDTASTILLKRASILKRIKDESENKLLREFIEQNMRSI